MKEDEENKVDRLESVISQLKDKLGESDQICQQLVREIAEVKQR